MQFKTDKLNCESERLAGPSTAPCKRYWDNSDLVFNVADKCAKIAMRNRFSRDPIDYSEALEDARQQVLATFFEIHPDERPRNVEDFALWALKNARLFLQRHHRAVTKTVSENVESEGRVLLLTDVAKCWIRPEQDIRMDFLDMLAMIKLLPREDRDLVESLLRHEGVVGFCEDTGSDVFDCVARLRRARDLMVRLAEDEKDERKFG